jgi:hypothetical protein
MMHGSTIFERNPKPVSHAVSDLNKITEDVEIAFRREVKKAHPDVGGTAELFRKLVEARDRLLASLGTTAPPPKPPEYAPKGMRVIYRHVKLSGLRRLGSSTLRLGRAG